MADTQRSLSELQTLLAENSDGNISSQDMRDVLVSLTPSFGRCSMQANATTTAGGSGTFSKILGTTAMSGDEVFFDDDTGVSNRLKYTGVSPRHVHIAASLSMSTSSGNKICEFKAYHWDASVGSGSLLDSSLISRKTGAGAGDLGAAAVHADVMMDTNDYIEIWATCEDASTITVEDLYFFAMTMLV